MIIKMIQAGIENERLENEAKNEAKRVFKVLKNKAHKHSMKNFINLKKETKILKRKFVYYFKRIRFRR